MSVILCKTVATVPNAHPLLAITAGDEVSFWMPVCYIIRSPSGVMKTKHCC